MSITLMVFILGMFAIRAFSIRSGRRMRYGSTMLEEKVIRLETQVADLQEQMEQDRAALGRLEEERDFLKKLYPSNETHAIS